MFATPANSLPRSVATPATIVGLSTAERAPLMDAGAIVLVEIPVRDLTRAADFYAGLFGWSFEHDEAADGWFFTTGTGGPMGRITIGRPAGRDGVRVTVAVVDVAASTRRAVDLGGGTAEAGSSGSSDLGEWTVLIDPDGNRFGIFHRRLRDHYHGRKRSGLHDGGPR
jgi:predicted enzyme related to lactoylglutathione lyase